MQHLIHDPSTSQRPPPAREPGAQALLDALASPTALLDEDGGVIGANEAWLRLAGRGVGLLGFIGETYLDVCRRRAETIAGASIVRQGLSRVLRGVHGSFQGVCRDPEGRDYRVRIARLRDCEPARYLVSHEEITELTEAQRSAREASDRAAEIQAQERERLAEELHDSVGQNLVSIGLGLARLRAITAPSDVATSLMGDMSNQLQEAHTEIRTVAYLLHPPWGQDACTLEDGMQEFARGFARRAGLQAEVSFEGPPCDLPRSGELTLFRILQEALVNVHRHAHASRVQVMLRSRRSEVVLQVGDDGVGFAASEGGAARPGVGLLGIKARVRRLGGATSIETGPGGTTLTVCLPTTKPAPLRPVTPRPRRTPTLGMS